MRTRKINSGKYWDKAWSLVFQESFLFSTFTITVGFIMYEGMTSSAYCYSIINIVPQFFMNSPRFNMVNFKVTTFIISALLAYIMISLKNCLPPLMIFGITGSFYGKNNPNWKGGVTPENQILRNTIFAFFNSKISQQPSMFQRKRFAFHILIALHTFRKSCYNRKRRNMGFMWQRASMALAAFSMQSILAATIFGKLFYWFPLFTSRTTLQSLRYFFKIFLKRYTNSSYPHFLCSKCSLHIPLYQMATIKARGNYGYI